MKQIKYLFVSALLMGFSTAALAQDGTAADVDAVKNLIKSKPADLGKQMNNFYKKNKKNPENIIAFGQAFLEAEDTVNAAVAAQKALEATKNKYAPAYMLLGDIAAHADNGGEAAKNYDMAIYNDPKLVDAYRKYANVYRKRSPEEAEKTLNLLRQNVPDFPVDAETGHTFYTSGNYEKALEYFNKANINKLEEARIGEYALSALSAGDYAKGLSVAKTAMQRFPTTRASSVWP